MRCHGHGCDHDHDASGKEFVSLSVHHLNEENGCRGGLVVGENVRDHGHDRGCDLNHGVRNGLGLGVRNNGNRGASGHWEGHAHAHRVLRAESQSTLRDAGAERCVTT